MWHVGPEARVTLSDWAAQRQMREIRLQARSQQQAPRHRRLTADRRSHRHRSAERVRLARLAEPTGAGKATSLPMADLPRPDPRPGFCEQAVADSRAPHPARWQSEVSPSAIEPSSAEVQPEHYVARRAQVTEGSPA